MENSCGSVPRRAIEKMPTHLDFRREVQIEVGVTLDRWLVRTPTNRDVVERFLAGERGMTRNLSTDGIKLFSYMLPIAIRQEIQRRILVTLLVSHYVSKTTNVHLGLLVKLCNSRGIAVSTAPKEPAATNV